MVRKTYCIMRRYGHDDYTITINIKTFSRAVKELNAWKKLIPSAAYYIAFEEA